MLFVDDFAVVRIGERTDAVLPLGLADELADEFLLDCGVAVDIVRRNTGLTAVQELAKHNAAGGELELCRFGDHTGTLSAELERHGREVFRGMAHDLFSDCRTSSEEQIVERFLQQVLVFRPSARDDRNIVRLKALGNQRLQNRACAGRIGARFNHRSVSGGKRVNQRIEREHKRIVPRTHDQHDTVRRRLDIAARNILCKRCAHAVFSGIRAHMLEHKADFTQHNADLAHIALGSALAEVSLQGVHDFGFLPADGILQTAQRRDTELNRQCDAAGKVRLLSGDDISNFFRIHGFPPSHHSKTVPAAPPP